MKRHQQSSDVQKQIKQHVDEFRKKLTTARILNTSEFSKVFGEQLAERLIIFYEDFQYGGNVEIRKLEKSFKEFLRQKGKLGDFHPTMNYSPKHFIETQLLDKCVSIFEDAGKSLKQLQDALRSNLKIVESSDSEDEVKRKSSKMRTKRSRSSSKESLTQHLRKKGTSTAKRGKEKSVTQMDIALSSEEEAISIEYSEHDDSNPEQSDHDEEYFPPGSTQQQKYQKSSTNYPKRHALQESRYQKKSKGYQQRHVSQERQYQRTSEKYPERHAVQERHYRQTSEGYPERHALEEQRYQQTSKTYPERHALQERTYQQTSQDYHERHAAQELKYQLTSKVYPLRHLIKQQEYRERGGYAKENEMFKQHQLEKTKRNLKEELPNEHLSLLNLDVVEKRNFLGKRDVRCPFCGALHFKGQHNCCGNGRIFVPPFPKLPPPLDRLLLKDTPESRKFKKNELEYNCIHACGSGQYHHEQVAAFGARVVKLRGSVHHFTSCVKPWNEKNPKFGNFYIYQGEEAVQQRMNQSIFAKLDKKIVRELTECMEKNYPYSKFYWRIGELIKQEEAAHNDPNKVLLRIVDARTVDKKKLQQHPSTYVPATEGNDFVAVFLTIDEAQNFDYPGINIYHKLNKGAPPMPIFPWMSQINSLLYPLLFPRGEGGWASKAFPVAEDQTKGFAERLQEYAEQHPEEVKLWNFNLHDVEGCHRYQPLQEDPNLDESFDEGEQFDENEKREYKDKQIHQTFSAEQADDPEGLAVESNIVMVERNGQLYPQRVMKKKILKPIKAQKMVVDPLDPEEFRNYEEKEDDLLLDDFPYEESEFKLNEVPSEILKEMFGPESASPADEKEKVQEQEASLCEQEEKEEGTHTRKFISLREWTMYVCQDRPWEFSRLTAAGKLSQLWIIDICTRLYHCRTQALRNFHSQYTTSTRTEFIKAMQRRMDAISTKNGTIPRTIGCISSIPSNVPGSPRYLMERFENACVMTNELGHADLFITFTANAGWDEIKKNLRPGQTWSDNPFLMNEVFHRKLDEFFNVILGQPIRGNKNQREPGIFGVVRWMTYSIEFQARGPPHAHIIVSLLQHIRTAAEVDKICQAYIPQMPDKEDDQFEEKNRLRDLVMKFMIHRPCDEDPQAYCKVGTPAHWEKCRKGFPKEFSDVTRLDDRDYPHLRRPDDGQGTYVSTQGREDPWADNRWVVSSNFRLLSMFECHINVEVISSLLVLRYIFKYIFKGFDRVLVEAITNLAGDSAVADMTITGHVFHPKSLHLPDGAIRARNKEVEKRLKKEKVPLVDAHGNPTLVYDENYIMEDLRCITPCEAAWQIAGYKRSDSMYIVVPLYVHMPHEEPIHIEPGKEEELYQHIMEQGVESRLNAWFNLNKTLAEQGEQNKLLTFRDVPVNYIYEKGKFRPRKRTSEFIRGHVKQVNPKNLELFAIRLLSMNLKGVTSFDDMRTVDGLKYKSFAEAAKKQGLMNDQDEWKNAIEEANNKTPLQLRRMFATILLFCAVIDPLALWRDVKKYLLEKKPDWTEEMRETHALYHIASILRIHGVFLDTYFLPELNEASLQMIPQSDLIDESKEDQMTKDEALTMCNSLRKTLNPEQEKVFNTITESIDSNNKQSFFIHGQGGSGKTYLYRTLYHYFRHKGLKVMSVAHTGVAAMLLPYGSTAHSAFNIPLTTAEDMHCKMKIESREAEALSSVNVVLWDEAPMTDRRIFQAVDELFRELHKADPDSERHLFAGIPFILGGDFRQTLPIVPGVRGDGVLKYTIRKSEMWHRLKILELTTNMRAKDDQDYCEYILGVGDGTANIDDTLREENQEVEIYPSTMVDSEEAVIEALFGKIEDPNRKILDPKFVDNTSILTVDNRTTFELNRKVLNLLPGKEHVYKSIDVYDETKGFAALDPEFYHASTPSGLPPHKLELREGAIVMLLRNINVRKGLVNGTRIRITHLGENIIVGIPLSQGQRKPIEEVILHRIRFTTTSNSRELAFSRWQFPVRLAFAITINKSQGQTLEHVGIILRSPVFAHGQLYVAFSRVRNSSAILVYNATKEPYKTINVVHRKAIPKIASTIT